ncbi:hypothetical protein AGMMS49592_5530 [Endomicrobiia bacterium]|nr:hypothetical protein AGMMS49592_5530 [Endomicrobiia bacterium]
MSNFIKLKKVSVLRGDRKILDNVDLNINSDENVAIIGQGTILVYFSRHVFMQRKTIRYMADTIYEDLTEYTQTH